METCHHCDSESDFPFRCQYCDGIYCKEHRLPENHDCDGVEFLSESGKRFESKISDEIVHEGDEIRKPEPIEPGTVGTPPEPEYEGSPPVKLKDTEEKKESHKNENRGHWILKLLRKLFRR